MQGAANRIRPGGGSSATSAETAATVEDQVALESVMERAASENFPVALRILPAHVRRHLQAIYGYARFTDNLGDEFPGDRSAALDRVATELDLLFAGTPRHPVFRRLAPTVAGFGLPRTPFDRLLAANRMDQARQTYADWGELMEYCSLSANPVGHLVLSVFESATPERVAASDAVCSGLQVLEHLQDVGEDARAGRVYLPADDMERFGCTIDDLLAPATGAGLRDLVAYETGRARRLLEAGRPLVASLRGYSRLAVAGYVAGGLAGLDAIEAAGHDVLTRTRQAGAVRLLYRLVPLYVGSLLWRRRGDVA